MSQIARILRRTHLTISCAGRAQYGRVRVRQGSEERAWANRRDDLHHLAGVADVLAGVDQQIADLQHRVNTLLDGETAPPFPPASPAPRA